MTVEIITLTVCGVIGAALILYIAWHYGCYLAKVISCPYKNAEITVKATGSLEFNHAYHYINGIWYYHMDAQEIHSSWDEAKIDEPISTLLSLIYNDFDNFTYYCCCDRVHLEFKHLKLSSIRGEVKEFVPAIIAMCNKDIKITAEESNAIRHFFLYGHTKRKDHQKMLDDLDLEKERKDATNEIVNKINEYLKEKENDSNT